MFSANDKTKEDAMRAIEWKPIGMGIAVALGLLVCIMVLLGAPSKYLIVLGGRVSYFIPLSLFSLAYILGVLMFLFPLASGSFIVGRYSTIDTFLQRISTGVFYYLLSWICLFYGFKVVDNGTSFNIFLVIVPKIIDAFVLLGFGYLFFGIGRTMRIRRLPDVMED